MTWGRTWRRFWGRVRHRAAPTTDELIGRRAIVVTSVPADGFGEIRVRVSGQPLKLLARASKPVSLGASVVVVQALNATSVVITEE